MSIEGAGMERVIPGLSRTSVISRGSCRGTSEEPCLSGCWFLLSELGCKQGDACSHCHQDTCCMIADLKRKDMRRQHSRMRPSKKKRDRMTKARTEVRSYVDFECGSDTATTAGWETSHSAVGSLMTPPSSCIDPSPSVDLRELQALLELIQES